MFDSCIGLTGTIPELPSTLQNADYMFYDSRGRMKLSGKSPKKPASVTSANSTFYGTKVTNDGSWSDEAFKN